jgi:hypothetical protein
VGDLKAAFAVAAAELYRQPVARMDGHAAHRAIAMER